MRDAAVALYGVMRLGESHELFAPPEGRWLTEEFPWADTDPAPGWSSFELAGLSGVRSSLLYPALEWLEERGCVYYGFERVRVGETRPPRRIYRVTGAQPKRA